MEKRSHSVTEVEADLACTGRPACELLATLFSTIMGLMLLLGQWSRLDEWIGESEADVATQQYGTGSGVCAISLLAELEGTWPGYLLAGFFLALAVWYGSAFFPKFRP